MRLNEITSRGDQYNTLYEISKAHESDNNHLDIKVNQKLQLYL